MGLTMGQRKALTREMAARYRGASRPQKKAMLDEFVEMHGCTRHHAGWLLRMWGKTVFERRDGELVKIVVGQRLPRRRSSRVYDEQVAAALKKVWYLFGCLCGKRLVAVLRTQLPVLEKFGELALDPDTRRKLTLISAATIDRLLRTEKRALRIRGRSHTKPTTRLMNEIPIRTFTEWQDARPGEVGADLVGHDGGITGGEHALVRRHVGYLRLETEQEVELLNELYDRLRLLINFFYPSQKLVAKTRQGARVRRVHDDPQTPYQRVLACPEVSEERKDRLRRQFDTLNPAELQREVVRLQSELLSLVQQRSHPAQRAG